jgi:hypothetical protein
VTVCILFEYGERLLEHAAVLEFGAVCGGWEPSGGSGVVVPARQPIFSLLGRYDNPMPWSVPGPHRLLKNYSTAFSVYFLRT